MVVEPLSKQGRAGLGDGKNGDGPDGAPFVVMTRENRESR
jgi:hypothetical protein